MQWCYVHFHALRWHSALSIRLCSRKCLGAWHWHLEMDVARLLQGVPDSSPLGLRQLWREVCGTALSRSSCLPFCQQSVQHENTYRDPIAKYCYGESPPELFPAWWAQKTLQAHAAKALSLKPGSATTSPLEESCRAEALALTTSWAVLCGLRSPLGFPRWGWPIKQLGNTRGSHLKKTNLPATSRRNWCYGHLHHCSCSGPRVTHSVRRGPSLYSYLLDFFVVVGKL